MDKPIYVSVFKNHNESSESSGVRITTFALGVHGNTIKEVKAKAKAEYPSDFTIIMDMEDYHKTYNANYYPARNEFYVNNYFKIKDYSKFLDDTTAEEQEVEGGGVSYGIIPRIINVSAKEVETVARQVFFQYGELVLPNNARIGVEK